MSLLDHRTEQEIEEDRARRGISRHGDEGCLSAIIAGLIVPALLAINVALHTANPSSFPPFLTPPEAGVNLVCPGFRPPDNSLPPRERPAPQPAPAIAAGLSILEVKR
jgi:hypothetical protein